ncbi:vesicle-associated membrane protein, putative [Entamoeba histolytica HM-1:IMSS-B]|uniref:Vesicle-associated membrane protein, putative n=6 Tax=Entamoeba TaxID=5758 RepID=B1N2W5_ENTH1|nr:vesicle-associated membrane protein, putative [Entamoeba dispar SAW760]XP_001913531.1 vesicle-associated membrane protein, putative [Entamoeba histolytica HM-1:IMSS]EMD48447.1 synaptobrevin protein, putative [Entamoeba histolytica KU27]EMH73312.1 vesicle-associated membrane protein, putative [Entamoeba histolytica HM-1:IMSS-B]EMS13674.1 synaptobrevin protein [Entamoeba histolytica HM-3:IMSS]ENY65831.1 synaptobrevin protein, putative [Entamoeba histolytica HM-1:IMSS-A]EDR25749.1 vesicle-ass|eukprot:EDR25749.1 vesicle-associated membrane protein, putative [Entamoeba dispar SAW760]
MNYKQIKEDEVRLVTYGKPKFSNAKKPRASEVVKQKKEQKKALIEQEPENEKIRDIYRDVKETQDIMADNIDKMTRNLEQAEDLEEKTDAMVEKANTFKKQSHQMKKAMCWRKWKLWIIIGVIAAIIIAVIVVVVIIPIIKKFT